MDFEKEYNSELNRRLNMNATSMLTFMDVEVVAAYVSHKE